MGKKRLQTVASGEAARLGEDKSAAGSLEQGPGPDGNEFDIHMQDELDGVVAAQKVVRLLKTRGVALIEANAPHELLCQAFDEAEALWKGGDFGAPIKAHDQGTHLEAQLWNSTVYQDEQKVFWVAEEVENSKREMEALLLLSNNMMQFANGLGDELKEQLGMEFSHCAKSMLTCYTGNRSFNLHIDNPHLGGAQNALPDNGMKVTCCYYLNPHWDPDSGYNGGGLDVFLTDPGLAPESTSVARKAPRLRVAPHADTLVVFTSERMAHQVVETQGKDRWFCLTVWCYDQDIMSRFGSSVIERARYNFGQQAESDDDDD
eukprot:TRINITY_DN89378_c0_g1_i1.p1 TRINITY_DN89378_c0_g1~~TRINITY_DN89378_c0_g1_i1.p1  ORF type:complete len:318 (+),score=58.96 TRINITY_DN89378_c0_g1_i1:44-997(+)